MAGERPASADFAMPDTLPDAEPSLHPRSRSSSSTPSISVIDSTKAPHEDHPADQVMSSVEEVVESHDDAEQGADGEVEPELMDEGGTATPQSSRAAPQQQPTFDPRALLNPKAAAKRPASSEAGSDRGRDEVPYGGQISLVERLHNVHERAASPAKRVKTEDEQRKQHTKATISGGSALDLKKENGQPAPVLKQAAIDLTMSDDEEDKEILVVKDNSSQLICIGRIKQVYVQSHMVPHPDPTKYRGNSGSQARIKVAFRRGGSQKSTNIILVTDPTNREFGRVDMKTAQGLAPLMDSAKQNGLMWIALTEPRRKQPGEGPPGSALSTLIALTLQLYCPRRVAHDLGRYLKGKNIALGDPVVELQKYDYYNPQTAASFNTQEAMQPDFEIPSNGGYSGSRYASNNSFVLRSVDEVRSDVLNMFDAIVNLKDIPERDTPRMLKTQLMKHQRQALHFLCDKEAEWTDEDEARKDSLYQAKYRPTSGEKYYLHVITGEELGHKPQSTRGGILADEMGLGKTLSILALVADDESMAAAKAFSKKAPPISQGLGLQQVKNSRATLLLCPLSTMVNWRQQIEEHFPDKGKYIKWCFYHGQDRKKFTVEDLADHDIVITTYHMVAADALVRSKPLGVINWFRIVLDEAHTIRSGKTKQATSVYTLAADRRWAVTGTPVQNRLEDLGALFKFLRIKPFDEAAGFNQHILNPFKNADPDVVPKLQLLVSSVTLRRLKQGNVDLPPREDLVVRLEFSRDERQLHDWFEQDSQRQVNAVTSGEKLGGHAYARILKAILYLRLICAHGRDLLGDEALKLTDGMSYENPMELGDDEEPTQSLTRKAAYDMLELLNETSTDKCQYENCNRPILEEDDSDDDEEGEVATVSANGAKASALDTFGYMTPCYHIICPRHLKKLKTHWDQNTMEDGHVICQFCEGRIRPVLFELKKTDWHAYLDERERIKKDPKLAKKAATYTGPHTKTKALLGELDKNKEESMAHPDEPPVKSVIFSCWTTHLDLIQIALENHGHTYTRLDGRMDRKSRDRALTAFADDPNVRSILVSIGAGGLGLNLTSANKAYVMEPQFNPAAEAQAVDRVHRLGQKRPVTILRYIMEQSFEEKMLELQRKKKALADLTMAREKSSKEQAAKKKLEELRSLFR